MHVVKQLHVLYDVMTWLPCAFHLNSLCCPWPVDDQEIHAVFRLMEFVRKKHLLFVCQTGKLSRPGFQDGYMKENKHLLLQKLFLEILNQKTGITHHSMI